MKQVTPPQWVLDQPGIEPDDDYRVDKWWAYILDCILRALIIDISTER